MKIINQILFVLFISICSCGNRNPQALQNTTISENVDVSVKKREDESNSDESDGKTLIDIRFGNWTE